MAPAPASAPPARAMLSKRHLWAIVLCLVATVYAFAFYCQLPPAPSTFHDFPAYYIPAKQLLRGANPYLISLPGVLAPADTPTWLLCFEPLAALMPHTAAWAWFWINVLALLFSLLLLIKEAGFRGSEAIIVAAICLMYPPIASNLWFGQSEIFLCLFVALMLVALRHGYDGLAGMSLAAAALLRAYPFGLIAYLLVLRRWRALGWTAVGVTVGGLLTVLFVGWRTVETYVDLIGMSRGVGIFGLTATLHVPGGLMKHPANLNLGAFVKWLYDRTASRSVPLAVSIFGVLAEIAAVVAGFHATVGIDPDDSDWRGFGLWIVTLSLISPLSWYFYFCCFLPLIIGMAAAWRRGYLPSAALYAFVAAYLIGTVLPTYGHPLYPFFEAAIKSMREKHPHIDHAISEKEFAALILTWLAAYLFVISACRAPRRASNGRAEHSANNSG
ncbi:MAG: glycosyltransferase family 87 protein [Candidatus Binataceae bacterium]